MRLKFGLPLLSLLLSGMLGFTSQARIPSPSHRLSDWRRSWPMVGHDPQRSSRSSAVVGLHLRLRGSYPDVRSPAVVGPGGGIYVWTSNGLSALGPSGGLRWTYPADLGDGGPPVVTPGGLLIADGFTGGFVSPSHARIFGLRSNGTLAWQIPEVGFSQTAAPLATKKRIYVPFLGPRLRKCGLGVISPSGRGRVVQRRFAFIATAQGKGGGIYAIGRYPPRQHYLRIERLTPSGRLSWKHRLGLNGYGLLVGRHGTLYVSNGADVGRDLGRSSTVRAYDPQGRLLWTVHTNQGQSNLAQAHNGAILAAGQLGITAIGPNGVVHWRRRLSHMYDEAVPSIAVDAGDRSYVESGDSVVRIISRRGKLVDRLQAGASRVYWQPSVAISSEGRLIVLGGDAVLRIYSVASGGAHERSQ